MLWTGLHARLRRWAPAALAVCAVALLAAGFAAPASATPVTFRYQPVIGGVSSVAVAGSFNGWNLSATPMLDPDKDGIFEATVDVPPGRVEYKWVVNGSQWLTDDGATDFNDDGFGGKNSVVVVASAALTVGTGSAAKKAPAVTGMRSVTFTFKPAQAAQSVSVAGQFNDWAAGKTPLTDDGTGTWSTTMLLPPGDYQYKFVVNGTQWTQDTAGQDDQAADGFGGNNSIKRVDARFAALDVHQGDGKVYGEGIQHAQGASEINNMGHGRVEFTARAHRGDIDGIDLVTYPSTGRTVTPMTLANQDKAFAYYRATVTVPGAVPYLFRYHDGAAAQWMSPAGLEATENSKAAFTFDPAKVPAFETPDWVKNAVIYQIFPDRFANGDSTNDQDFHEWYYAGKHTPPAGGMLNLDYQEYYHLVRPWSNYQALTQASHTPDHRDWMAFYGGDIEGVRQKLGYLKDLGITAIYFNPVFEAKSTHKYDAADYRKIDPHFGTNEQFIAFVKEAHAAGIRIILDIVYNHSGNSNWAFKDAVEKGPQSPHYSWYDFTKWPLPEGWPNVQRGWKPADYYHCWWGYGDLPDLNFDLAHSDQAEVSIRDIKQATPNKPLIDYLLDATEYWLTVADIDGVRLDVPNEVPMWFWSLFNQRVKSVKPDAYIVGELWGNASDYVKPGMYDAVMNYAFFKDPVMKFLGMGQGTAADFDNTLASGRLTYPSQAVATQMNVFDSHDTVRFLTAVGGNPARLKLAALFGMTYIGAPTVYYGDEIGMAGDKDPDCRRPFVWTWQSDPQRVDMHAWYKSVIGLRNAHAALRTGDFITLVADGMTYAYARSGNGENFVIALNAGKSPATLTLDTARWGGTVTATNALTGEKGTWTGKATLTLPAETGKVFQLTK